MTRRFALAAVALSIWISGCSGRPKDEAPPVATPSLSIRPAVAAPGSPIELSMTFAVAPDAPPFSENYTVFVHILDRDGRMIGTADHLPPTPTRDWKPGGTIRYTESAFAPVTPYLGMATVVVGLYSPATGQRVPLAGTRSDDRGIKAGTFELREHDDPYAVTYHEGWFEPESVRSAGLEWRWSSKSGWISFPNPNRAIELVMELDQPEAQFPVAQHVEVRMGGSVLDAFDLQPDLRVLRRVGLSPAQMGDATTVELELVADKTFTPADQAYLQSTDTRRLGIRVFRIYIEPK